MVPMKTVLVFPPPMTIIVLDDSCTAVQQYRGCRSPVMILTQELVRGKKTWTAGGRDRVCMANQRTVSTNVALNPPTANRLPLRLAAVDLFSGVLGRVFQTDVPLADW